MRPKTPLLVERDIDPGKEKREDARAMAAERGDGEEQEGDTEKLHREAPDGAPDLQPPVEREKKDEEGEPAEKKNDEEKPAEPQVEKKDEEGDGKSSDGGEEQPAKKPRVTGGA